MYAAIVARLVVFWRTATVRALCAVDCKDDGRAVNRVIDDRRRVMKCAQMERTQNLDTKLGFDRLGRVG